MNKHHKKVMKRQKNVQSNAQIAKIFCDLALCPVQVFDCPVMHDANLPKNGEMPKKWLF